MLDTKAKSVGKSDISPGGFILVSGDRRDRSRCANSESMKSKNKREIITFGMRFSSRSQFIQLLVHASVHCK